MSIPANLEKGNEDRLMPMTPEFVELLRIADGRSGYVFNPLPLRPSVRRLGDQQVGRMVGHFGKAARVVVNAKTRKTASAHDLRRSFGDRWAQKVMPAVLHELMRHESINTAMRYYVGRRATTTADILWKAIESDASIGCTSSQDI